ncbi:MAG: iron-containing alcohol dehydrogenase [Verrucomicrobiae bacterium]|nr:iron-containing alcohol dehydrogenase [Verrucomicrobiae bacterium]
MRSLRFGPGAVDRLGKELGRFVVTTMDVPWRLAQPRLGAVPVAVLFVENMEVETLDRQVAGAPEADTVLALGGGQAIDLGKYLAWKRGLRLVTVPTILSVDAFVTPAAGVRRGHRVEYVGQTSPDPLVIDCDLIRTAPAELNIAGVGDLLSIHTACRDWELAARAGRSEFPFRPEDVARARGILADTMARAAEIRACSDEGLRAIVEGYLRVNTICLPAGHYRVEEGSEHYVFYELEERLRRPFIHGWIVGLGVHLMSRLQENRHEEAVAFMDAVGLRYQPADLGIRREDLSACLLNLRRYVSGRSDLWYTVIHERDLTPEWIEAALATLKF